MKGRAEVLLNFGLGHAHVDHVGNQLDSTLYGARIEVRLVGDGPLNAKLFQAAGKIVNFSLQTGGVNVGQGEQLVNAGPHHIEEVQGRL